jgi:hypothetical protein
VSPSATSARLRCSRRRARCAPTPQTQMLRAPVADSPAIPGVRPGTADAAIPTQWRSSVGSAQAGRLSCVTYSDFYVPAHSG